MTFDEDTNFFLCLHAFLHIISFAGLFICGLRRIMVEQAAGGGLS